MVSPIELAKLQGRLNALEALVMMFSGIVLAQAPNDTDYSKAVAIMNAIRDSVHEKGKHTDCVEESDAAADELLSLLSENLRQLRPRP